MHEVSCVFQQVIDGFDDIAFAQHHLVIEGHESVLHVGFQPRDDVRPVLEQVVEELGRDVALVPEQPPVDPLGQHVPHPHVTVIHIGTREHEGDDLTQVVAHEVQLEPMAPAHRSLAVGGQPLEHPVGVAAQVVAHRYHGAVHKRDAGAGAEGPEVEEEHHVEEYAALQLHEPVIGHCGGELAGQMDLDVVQVEVFEVAERAEVVEQQYGHDFAVRHARLAVAFPYPIAG